jgi:hypothetical protein
LLLRDLLLLLELLSLSKMFSKHHTPLKLCELSPRRTPKNPTKEVIKKLVKANEHNSARAAIAEHRAEGLKEALQLEKKKRRWGKKLNLIGEVSGRAQFFGTKEVLKQGGQR